ncbi:MAG TPA: fused MFS/spermidine synthase [Pirellulales bacterium]|nr:fused MFS/spermidine synthase [Pirellulales bacterium]
MTTSSPPNPSAAPLAPIAAVRAARSTPAWIFWNLALMILVSAFLLFQVEPLISKFILPWFGGSPAVWTTCLLFFQSLLFFGYAYAHLLNRLLTCRRQAILHGLLLIAAIAMLPVVPRESWKPDSAGDPTWRILGLLTCTVGLPYFVLSATGPLGQAWFSRAYPGRSPYRLYSLSNVGSLAALVTYPFLFEPAFTVPEQAWYWSGGFGLFIVLCGSAAFWIARHRGSEHHKTAETIAATNGEAAGVELQAGSTSASFQPEAGGWLAWLRLRFLWLALPACGSLMLLATTNHVCQDVAVVPFLWIVPLALYLVSFIICFDHERWYRRRSWSVAALALVFLASGGAQFDLPLGFFGNLNFDLSTTFAGDLALYFGALLAICMVCHGELVRLRPAPRHLTEFYLMIAAGGAIGGIFVSLIAPRIFKSFLEWNFGLVASYGVALVVWFIASSRRRYSIRSSSAARAPFGIGRMIAASLLAAGLCFVAVWQTKDSLPAANTIYRARNFYGLVSVRKFKGDKATAPYIELRNGHIRHGRQFLSPDLVQRQRLTTYYAENTGAGRAIRFFQSKPDLRVGVVGLGAGTLAAYARQPGQRITFYEINPEVEKIARTYFTFLKDCGGQADVVLGDARLSLDRAPPQKFDVLVLDAFSGDAPPAHLLTREAFAIYQRHMADGGIIAVHITNRYVDLAPVVQAAADFYHLGTTRIKTVDDDDNLIYHTDYMLLTNNRAFLNATPPELPPGDAAPIHAVVWTDHYSNLFQLLLRK